MKPQELRIGNLVRIRATKQIAEVTAINKLGVEVNDNNLAPLRFSEIEPVPLAEEWILNYGFRKTLWKQEFINEKIPEYTFDDGYNMLTITPRTCKYEPFTFWIGDCNVKHFKHVHELQNLYYDLTNEGLTLKTK